MGTLKEVQDTNTKLLAEVDRICRANNITYFMEAGTLLGAVRHKGSIPWDDDVDIMMKRADFNKFIQVAPSQLAESFELVQPKDYGENHFYDFITHVAYTNCQIAPTTGEMAFYNNKMNNILLDIFILDDIAENKIAQRWKIFKVKFLYGLSWAHRYHINYSDYKGILKCGVWVLSHLGKLFKQSKIEKKVMEIGQSDNGKGSKVCFSCNYIFEEIGIIYKKKWFDSAVELDYDGHKFMAPVGYEHILKGMYGNYMELPPVEARVPAHYKVDSPDFYIH